MQMLKYYLFIIPVAFLTLSCTNTGNITFDESLPSLPAHYREHLDIAGLWQAALDPNDNGETDAYYDKTVKMENAKEVTVPCSFNDIAPELERYEGPGWFRRSFTVHESWKGRRIVVKFEGVNSFAKVWINGQSLGENEDSFLPFEFEIQDVVNFGTKNFIAVRADTTTRTDTVPEGRIGWYQYGGIVRDVGLEATDFFRIARLHVLGEPAEKGGKFTVKTTLTNNKKHKASGKIAVRILTADNQLQAVCPDTNIEIEPGGSRELEVCGFIKNAALWSPEKPALYTARVLLLSEGEVIDSRNERFGFRKIEAKDAALYLNGKPILLTGFNRHEDSPKTDMSPDHELTRKDLMMMKNEFGCNFIRLCHYPHHPKTLEMCDEIGMLAMCELPLYMWRGFMESGEDFYKVLEAANRQLTKLIDRDYNHPCVIMWSVSNETWPQYPEVVGTNVKLVAFAKRLDPSRLAMHVSDHWRDDLSDDRSRQDHFGEDDVICINGYPHRIFRKDGKILSSWFDDIKRSELDPNLIAKFWRDGLTMLHKEYPDKPILVSEYGWRSDKGQHQQVSFIEGATSGMKLPWLCGVTIWCWADHPWPRSIESVSPYGIYTRDRRPKLAVEATKKAFADLRRYFAAEHGR